MEAIDRSLLSADEGREKAAWFADKVIRLEASY
jgi:hypothetical protein